ncbi:MAG: hypothetical protein ACOX58_13140 [Christensenellales bacterium]|jgi:hypothetical protein
MHCLRSPAWQVSATNKQGIINKCIASNGNSQVRDHGTIVMAQNMLRYTYPLFADEE